MAVYRVPGSIGCHATTQNIEDGTLCRAASPRPGPANSKRKIGHATSTSSPKPNKPNATPTRPLLSRKKPAALPVLREHIQGEQVRKLQQLLNSRVAPYPNLAVDGIFGPLTREAVVAFQSHHRIASDGIVGPQTWFILQKSEPAKLQPPAVSSTQTSTTAAATMIVQPAAASTAKRTIWEWSLQEKLLDVISRIPSRLGPQLRKEWETLIEPQSLVISLVIIAGFCFLSGGTALILGLVLLGIDVGMALATAIMTASQAATDKELDEAADELAHVVITLGVAAFLHGVGKAVGKLRGGGKTAGTPKETPPPSATKKPSATPNQNAKPPVAEPQPAHTPQTGAVKTPPNAAGSGKPKIHSGKQGKHVPGHNNFQPGKSELTHPNPQDLLNKHAGTGIKHGPNKEAVDFGEPIGNCVNNATGEKVPTTRGTIHYDNAGGAHIVPSNPNPAIGGSPK